MHLALRESWHAYTKHVVALSEPEHVVCIGKGVASVIGSDLRGMFGDRVTVIAQPNAHLPSEEHMANYQLYGTLCLR